MYFYHLPSIFVLQKEHFPFFIEFLIISYPILSIITFLQAGQIVLLALDPGILPIYTYFNPVFKTISSSISLNQLYKLLSLLYLDKDIDYLHPILNYLQHC